MPRFRSGQCRAFARVEITDQIPDQKAVEPPVGFAILSGFARVHFDAESSAIDLQRAQLDQMVQGPVEPILVHHRMDSGQGVQDFGNFLLVSHGIRLRHRHSPHAKKFGSMRVTIERTGL